MSQSFEDDPGAIDVDGIMNLAREAASECANPVVSHIPSADSHSSDLWHEFLKHSNCPPALWIRDCHGSDDRTGGRSTRVLSFT